VGAGGLRRCLYLAGNVTVKSDDVQGRVNTYEAIVKGEPIEDPSIPASFRVLVKELQSLGLAVEAINETGDVVKLARMRRKPIRPGCKQPVGHRREADDK